MPEERITSGRSTVGSIKVLVVDDHPAIRLGLALMLAQDQGIEVVGEADSAFAAMQQVEALQPHVILLDVKMPGASGIDIVRLLRQGYPDLKVVLLSAYEETEYVTRAVEAGAHAYLLKSASKTQLTEAIRAVCHGERLVAPNLMGKILDRFETISKDKTKQDAGLSRQEVEILQLLATGASNKDVANQLFLSEITVVRKVQEIIAKLGVTNRTHAVAEALRRGLI